MSLWCDGFYVTPQGYYVTKVITRLLHQGISRLLRHGDVDQTQTVSKSAEFRCKKNVGRFLYNVCAFKNRAHLGHLTLFLLIGES